MNNVLSAIAEPRRRAILDIVREGEHAASEIAAQFDISAPAVSQHLKVLRESGLVNERRAGRYRLYSARPDGLRELYEYLGSFWTAHLMALKTAVERGQSRDRPGEHK